MTRATLLHVLDRPTALGPAEVRELEQLAQAFPYCQTAHLLLAKAAHDQGTMLAGQRLRRAATYAADRSLLRRLIEQVAPEPLPAAISLEVTPAVEVTAPTATEPLPAAKVTPAVAPQQPVAPVAVVEIFAPPLPAVANEVISEPVVAVGQVQPVAMRPAVPTAAVEIETPLPPAVALQLLSAPAVASAAPVAISEAPVEIQVATIEAHPATVSLAERPIAAPAAQTVDTVEVALPLTVPESLSAANSLEGAISAAEPTPVDLPILVDQEGAAIPANALAEAVETAPALPAEVIQTPEIADELPAQAPAIRPPVEVGEARFEFGLADAPPAALPTYELPGLIDEWAASAVTRSLGIPDALALTKRAPAAPVFTPAAFTGDAVVGYSFGESSRLGLSMQLLDLLTAKAEAAESNTAVVAAAQPPAGPLPPTGTFFEPDPLLLDHWATHCPVPPELPSTVDLINNFLKRQPRLTRPGMLPPAPGGQPDLSVRSTRAEPDLVSENLARIFVRQGKTVRAIEIYEKLMVKQPEKMAYFAAQIQSLQPSA